MITRYAIQRQRDAWYWLGGTQWVNSPDVAVTFAHYAEAELTGLVDCPLPMREWTVVPVRAAEPVVGSDR